MRQQMASSSDPRKCLACGQELAPALVVMGSLRCHDCRDDRVALRTDLVEPVSVEEEHRAA
jgi:hypothetical protein